MDPQIATPTNTSTSMPMLIPMERTKIMDMDTRAIMEPMSTNIGDPGRP